MFQIGRLVKNTEILGKGFWGENGKGTKHGAVIMRCERWEREK